MANIIKAPEPHEVVDYINGGSGKFMSADGIAAERKIANGILEGHRGLKMLTTADKRVPFMMSQNNEGFTCLRSMVIGIGLEEGLTIYAYDDDTIASMHDTIEMFLEGGWVLTLVEDFIAQHNADIDAMERASFFAYMPTPGTYH